MFWDSEKLVMKNFKANSSITAVTFKRLGTVASAYLPCAGHADSEFAEILAHISSLIELQDRFIVAGDFNVEITSKALESLPHLHERFGQLQRGRAMTEREGTVLGFVDAHNLQAWSTMPTEAATHMHYVTKRELVRDYVFASTGQHFKFIQITIMPYTSDHYIVETLFSYPSQEHRRDKSIYQQPIIKNWAPDSIDDFRLNVVTQVCSGDIDQFAEKI